MRFPTRRLLAVTAGALLLTGLAVSQKNQTPEAMLRTAMDKETVDGDLKGAIEQYKKVIAQKGASRDVVAKALVRLGGAYEKQGSAEARPAYERVVREFADQAEAAQEARARLDAGPSKAAGKSLRQICAGADCDGYISPDGRYLTFLKDGNLFVRDLTTGQTRQLTHVPAGTRAAAALWAPDSKRIAYADPTAVPRKWQAAIINVDGSGARTIYREDVAYSWSADGKRLLIGADDDTRNLTKLLWVGVADSAVQTLPTARQNLDVAKVSPDGRYVSFNASKDKDSEENVYIMASDGSGETLVSASPSYQEPVGWTPDGKYLLFEQSMGNQTSLWAITINRGKPGVPIPIQSNSGSDSVRFRGITRSGALYYRLITYTSDVFTASMDSTSGRITSAPVPVPLSRSGHNQGGKWSPDGHRIINSWGQPTSPLDTTEFWIYSLDGGKEQRVASNIVSLRRGAYWSEDGESILFNTPRALATSANQSEPIQFNLSTGIATPLFPGAASFSMDSYSDGLLADYDPTGRAIKVRNLKTGSETEVHKYVQRQPVIFSPFLSHDGRWVAFRETRADGSTGLFVVSTKGGTARELARVKSPDNFVNPRGVAWSPDDRFVYFARRPDGSAPFDLMRVPASGGAEEGAGLKWPGLGNFDIAPDGKHIAFAAGGQQTEIWAMENFLPPAK